MNQGKLKEIVKNHYLNKELSVHQLDRLNLLNKKFLFQWSTPLVASFVLLFFLTFFYFKTPPQDIIAEIAYNHMKSLSSEYESQDLSVLQKKMNKLDFTMISSAKLPTANWKVLGARYCSLQGKMAAQIKIMNLKTLEVYTLYQAKLVNKNLKLLNGHSYQSGVAVKVWQEKGLVLGLAGKKIRLDFAN